MPVEGSKAVISVSTDGGVTYNPVANLNSVTNNESGATIETTAFGADWKTFMAGLNDFTVDLAGLWDPADLTGQVALRNAWKNRTTVNVKVLYDGLKGVSGAALVTKVERKAAPGGAVDATFALQGSGPVTDI